MIARHVRIVLQRRLVVASILMAVACGERPPTLTPVSPSTTDRTVVRVQNRWLLLHLSSPPHGSVRRPLVLFVTGDGGWRGKDLDAFRHLAAWGHPIAGFSAPDYLGHLRDDAASLPPHQLARDFSAVIGAASAALALGPDPKAVLVGVSRGGDLAVVAAAEAPLRPSLLGVLAVGLTGEEEYVRHRRRRMMSVGAGESLPANGPRAVGEMVKPYEYLTRIDMPVCLIQSTNDEYVQAAEARQLFGPDTPTRRFLAVPARNHSFSNARDVLYHDMQSSLDWLVHSGRSGAR